MVPSVDMNHNVKQAIVLLTQKGFQLEVAAFERLFEKENPYEIAEKLIKQLEEVPETPIFITKKMIEEVEAKVQPKQEEALQQKEGETRSTSLKRTTAGTLSWRPYSKEVDAKLEIVVDPSEHLSSGGSIENFMEYIRDRYDRLERIIRRRMDVRGTTSITEAMNTPRGSDVKVIGMITQKRERGRLIFMEIEDREASTSVLVPLTIDREKFQRAQGALLDQVICVVGRKSREDLIVASDIINPDIPEIKPNMAFEEVHVALLSDLHVGSREFLEKVFERFLLWLKGEVGNGRQKYIAGRVKYVVIAGDLVDGIGVYPSQEEELKITDIYEQYKATARLIEKIPEYIEVIIIPGNHDATRQALPQPAIMRKYAEPIYECRKVRMLGDPSWVKLHDVEFLLYHGRSLDDVIGAVPGVMYRNLQKTVGRAMEQLLKVRHLAPMYGQKTPIAAEKIDWLVIDRVPDIFHAGHVHVEGYKRYRGRLIVNSGTFQDQTAFMKKMGLMPTPGIVPIVNLQNFEVNQIDFKSSM